MIEVLEHNGVKVVTTAELSEVLQCNFRAISEIFNENCFHEGKDYFKLEGEALRDFKKYYPINKYASTLYLWTNEGACRIAEILDPGRAEEITAEIEASMARNLTPIEELLHNARILAIKEREILAINNRIKKILFRG